MPEYDEEDEDYYLTRLYHEWLIADNRSILGE